MELTVYLAGQIHDTWREDVKKKAKEKNLPLVFVAPQTNHERSDNIGEEILGQQPGNLYKDNAASDINNFRTQVLMQKADIVIALFGEKYKQWNTAMDVSTAIAMNKPTIIIRPESLIHPLKELSNKANVTVETVDQALEVISYIFEL
ncbi:YtoQ family protein [Bacillus salipaludis]|uniref:YtoQ family protein n=1 Tax=Bacillus salipaludis TaxID=2547811 RepID=A0ABW8RK36_9BACI